MDIEEIIERRKITQLVHFTAKENLESINRFGLLSRKTLDERGIKYIPNDPRRSDNFKNNGISISVTSFNNYVLNAFLDRFSKSPSDYILVVVKPKILIEKTCFFFHTNAASTIFRDKVNKWWESMNNTSKNYQNFLNEPKSDLMEAKAFEKMFDNEVETTYRARKRWKSHESNHTTCIQAEIMMLEDIEVDHIMGYREIK